MSMFPLLVSFVQSFKEMVITIDVVTRSFFPSFCIDNFIANFILRTSEL